MLISFFFCILLSQYYNVVISSNNVIFSGPRVIDKCGDIYFNIFCSSYFLHGDFEWKYLLNNISHKVLSSANKREVFISNMELLNLTNDLADDYVPITIQLHTSNNTQYHQTVLHMDTRTIFPYVNIDGDDAHYLALHHHKHNDYYNIIPNIHYSRCFPNVINMSLSYKWTQIFSSHDILSEYIHINNTDSKILQLPIHNMTAERDYVFEVTVSQNVHHHYTRHKVFIYTRYSLPVPLAPTIRTLNTKQSTLSISIHDLFYFDIPQDAHTIYGFQWLCYDITYAVNCSHLIQKSKSHDINVNTLRLFADHRYKFELIVSKYNRSVSSHLIYHTQTDEVWFDMKLLSTIPNPIDIYKPIKISICVNDIHAMQHMNWSLAPKYYHYHTELLLSKEMNASIGSNVTHDYVHFVSEDAQCSLQTNLYLDAMYSSDEKYSPYAIAPRDPIYVTLSALNSMISTELIFAQKPYGGTCTVLNNNDALDSSPVALFIYKYPHLFSQLRIACYDSMDLNADRLYYNFIRANDGIYLLDDWMRTTSYIEMPVFVQLNYTIYGLIRNEFGYVTSHLIEYISSKAIKKSEFHVLTRDLMEMLEVDLKQSISTNDYKLSFMIITSFLDVLKYGLHEHDFVNEAETVSVLVDLLFIHLQHLKHTFSPSSSYLSLQMIHILHSLSMDDMLWLHIGNESMHIVLSLIDIDGIQCDQCCLFKIFDIMSQLLSSHELEAELFPLIIDKIMHLSYVYLKDDVTATVNTVNYAHDKDILHIQLRNDYVYSQHEICRNIIDITHIPSMYPFDTIFCVKLELQNIVNGAAVISTVISSNPNQFELAWDAYSERKVCSIITTSFPHKNISQVMKYGFPRCVYLDLDQNEWLYNHSKCWLSDYNKCSCATFSSIAIVSLQPSTGAIAPLSRNISEHFDVALLNLHNIFEVYPIPLYIVCSLALVMITCLVLVPDTNDIPLWIQKKEANDKDAFINDEMGSIYIIYQVYAFQRCWNLFALNLKNNWFLSGLFCRLHGTNITTAERILLFYLYIITLMACDAYFYSQHIYDSFVFYPFLLLSMMVMIPILCLKFVLKQIPPVSFDSVLKNNAPKASNDKKTLNQIYSQIMNGYKYNTDDDDSYNSDHDDTPKLNCLVSPMLDFEETNTSMKSVDNSAEIAPNASQNNENQQQQNQYRICVEEMQFDPQYQWILDPKRSRQSPAKSVMIEQFTFAPSAYESAAEYHDFLWFTSICVDSIRFASTQAEAEITRSTLDKILHLLPVRYRDCIYCICNVDNESFIVFEEYIEFVDSILIATGQWTQMYCDINDFEFEFRDMLDVFREKVDIDLLFGAEQNRLINIDDAFEILVKLRGMNIHHKYTINDIAVPLLTGFSKKALIHCLSFCSRIFWKILTDKWWDYDQDRDDNHDNNSNILYHLTHTSFHDLFPHHKRYRNSSSGSSLSSYSYSSSASGEVLQSESSSFPSTSSESSVCNDDDDAFQALKVPTASSMNAPQPMIMIDDEDIIERNHDDDDYRYSKRILMLNKYYKFHFKWKKYIHFVIILWILYASIITIIYGVHLDFTHYFQNELKFKTQHCDSSNTMEQYLRYNRTESLVNLLNNSAAAEATDLTSQWLYCLLIQLLIYMFICEPIHIAIATIIQHQKYKNKALQYKLNKSIESHTVTDLISFFIR